jgi:hypothetical protein
MRTTTKIIGFLIGLVAVFGAALGVGQITGPVGLAVGGHDQGGHETSGATPESPSGGPQDIPGGLMVSQAGYTLVLDETTAPAGTGVPLSFTIEGPDGTAVTSFDVAHEKELHLIAVRRDFTGFQHVHPTMDADGRWTTPLDLTSGQWRVYADFTATGGNPLTLGADLMVPGKYEPESATTQTRTAVVDGYEVTIGGDLTPGTESELTLTVTRGGSPVTDLEPYLGSYGHLVALRAGDLAYLHVHPEGVPDDGKTAPGPDVVFFAAVPSPGDYHLYLDFKHEGEVRTAAFDLSASADTSSTADETAESPAGEEPTDESGDEHADH